MSNSGAKRLSKSTAVPNISNRAKGSLMITEKNVEVSYCGLGEVYQHLQRSRERKRKKIVSQDSRSPTEN
jgi:hypothetical protein